MFPSATIFALWNDSRLESFDKCREEREEEGCDGESESEKRFCVLTSSKCASRVFRFCENNKKKEVLRRRRRKGERRQERNEERKSSKIASFPVTDISSN